MGIAGEIRNRLPLAAKLAVLLAQERKFPRRCTLSHPGERHDAVLVLYRQLPEHDVLENGEHRARHANGEAEDQDCGDGESGRAA